MSRYTLPPRASHHEVVVGWDQPLLSFFVHVHDTTRQDDDANPVIWLGGRPRELYDIDDLRRAVQPYAELPPDIAALLYGDRDEGR